MRRAATSTMLTLTTLLLTAVPALATEGGGAGGDYFGAGQWDGMILAGIVGVVLGAVIVITVEDDVASGHGDGEHGEH